MEWKREDVERAYHLAKTMTTVQVAEALGLRVPQVLNMFSRYGGKSKGPIFREEAVSPMSTEQSTVTGDKWEFAGLAKDRITTLSDLVAFCQIDLKEWEIVRWTCNKWEVGAKDKDNQVQVTPLFQVKATMQRRKGVAEALNLIAQDIEDMRAHAPVYGSFDRPHAGEHLVMISIPDAHLGKLSWHEETGADYDLRIAVDVFREAVESLLSKIAGYGVNRICLVLGNDFLNADNFALTTTRGTPQHGDGRFPKVYRKGRELLVWTIEQCLSVAPVQVIMIPGNHDEQSVFTLGDSLMCWFRNCADVEIDNRPTSRKYMEFGKNLLAFEHGDGVKPKEMPLIMAAEAPEAWGRTKWREVITGHLHKTKLEDFVGVNVRILPSLCAADKWHHKQGYVGSRRAAEAYVYHIEDGWVGTAIHRPRG